MRFTVRRSIREAVAVMSKQNESVPWILFSLRRKEHAGTVWQSIDVSCGREGDHIKLRIVHR